MVVDAQSLEAAGEAITGLKNAVTVQEGMAEHPPINFAGKKNLVVASAGSRGFVYPGAMMALHDRGYKFENVAGASAGGKMATVYALGYRTEQDYGPVVMDYDFGRYSDLDFSTLRQLPQSLEKDGIFTGDEMVEWAEYASARRTGCPDLTFGQLKEWREAAKQGNLEFFQQRYEQAQSKQGELQEIFAKQGVEFEYDFSSPEELMQQAGNMVNLHLIATEVREDPDDALRNAEEKLGRKMDLEEQKAFLKENVYVATYFDAERSPDTSIAEAVARTAAIPYLFGRQEDEQGKEYVDGAVLESFAFRAFHEDGVPTEETLGLGTRRGSGYESNPGIVEKVATKFAEIKNPSLPATQAIFMENETYFTNHPQVRANTVFVNTFNESVADFGKTVEEKREMWQWGEGQMSMEIDRFEAQQQAQLCEKESPDIDRRGAAL